MAVVGVLAFAASARADFSVGLDREFSGGTAPEASAPWITATIADVAPDTVRLTLDATHLTGSEFVSVWSFNVAGANGATGWSSLSNLTASSDADIATTGIEYGDDAFKADGDGYFDIRFTWGNGQFTAGENAWFEFTSSGLTADDFNDLSLGSGNSPSGLVSAAHVQSIGQAGQSGWITGTPTTTVTNEAPIPGALMLASAGLGIVGFVRRRRA